MHLKPNILSSDQENILKEFIKTFLPKKGNKMKSSGNEIVKIQEVMNRLFKIHFGFPLSRKNIEYAFKELRYDIFIKKGDYRRSDGYAKMNDDFIYIDIDAKLVRQLLLTRITLPEKTKAEKFLLKDEMIKKIERFKENYTK
jgi:hypothetical protein